MYVFVRLVARRSSCRTSSGWVQMRGRDKLGEFIPERAAARCAASKRPRDSEIGVGTCPDSPYGFCRNLGVENLLGVLRISKPGDIPLLFFGLVANLSPPRVNKTKQHTSLWVIDPEIRVWAYPGARPPCRRAPQIFASAIKVDCLPHVCHSSRNPQKRPKVFFKI